MLFAFPCSTYRRALSTSRSMDSTSVGGRRARVEGMEDLRTGAGVREAPFLGHELRTSLVFLSRGRDVECITTNDTSMALCDGSALAIRESEPRSLG